MTDDDFDRKLAEISRSLFINRCLLVFIAVCAGVLLFLPQLALAIAEMINAMTQRVSPWVSALLPVIIVLGTVVGVGAYVVARIAPKPRDSGDSRK